MPFILDDDPPPAVAATAVILGLILAFALFFRR